MPLCHMRTAKVQISVCIQAIWSRHDLFVDIYYSIHWFCKRIATAQISLRECAGWSGPALSANYYMRALFVRWASYVRVYGECGASEKALWGICGQRKGYVGHLETAKRKVYVRRLLTELKSPNQLGIHADLSGICCPPSHALIPIQSHI